MKNISDSQRILRDLYCIVPDQAQKDLDYMRLSETAARHSNCCGRAVGAVLVRNNKVISTGFNGVPSTMIPCKAGGCFRCNYKGEGDQKLPREFCICVHAEQNTIIQCARMGVPVEGATLYVNCEPCFDCMKMIIPSGIQRLVIYPGSKRDKLDTVPAGRQGDRAAIEANYTSLVEAFQRQGGELVWMMTDI